MKTVLELDGDRRWVLLETQEEANREGQLSQTAVGLYFGQDQSKAPDAAGEARARYYSLRQGLDAAEVALVTGFVGLLPEGADPADPPSWNLIFVGRQNTDPFVRHAEAIADLSSAIGRPITDRAYPYSRKPGGMGDPERTARVEGEQVAPQGPRPR